MNVAKLAGLPDEVLSRAKQKSVSFEKEMGSIETDKMTAEEATELCSQLSVAIEAGDEVKADSLWERLNSSSQ